MKPLPDKTIAHLSLRPRQAGNRAGHGAGNGVGNGAGNRVGNGLRRRAGSGVPTERRAAAR